MGGCRYVEQVERIKQVELLRSDGKRLVERALGIPITSKLPPLVWRLARPMYEGLRALDIRSSSVARHGARHGARDWHMPARGSEGALAPHLRRAAAPRRPWPVGGHPPPPRSRRRRLPP